MRRFYEGGSFAADIYIWRLFAAERAAVVSLNIGAYDSGQVSDALSEEFGICTQKLRPAPLLQVVHWARCSRGLSGSAFRILHSRSRD